MSLGDHAVVLEVAQTRVVVMDMERLMCSPRKCPPAPFHWGKSKSVHLAASGKEARALLSVSPMGPSRSTWRKPTPVEAVHLVTSIGLSPAILYILNIYLIYAQPIQEWPGNNHQYNPNCFSQGAEVRVFCYFIECQWWDAYDSLVSAPKGSAFSSTSIRQLVFLSTRGRETLPIPYEAENQESSGQNELVDRESTHSGPGQGER